MLDLDRIALDDLAQALADRSSASGWSFDPKSGEVVREPKDRNDLIAIEPLPSRERLAELEDFLARVRNPQALETLQRAIAGDDPEGRFEEALAEFPKLREAWGKFHDARMQRVGIEWLISRSLVEPEAVYPEHLALQALEHGALQKVKELAALIRYLQPRTLRTVVEIGTARGGTLLVWCKLAEPDAHIASIDLPDEDDRGGAVRKSGWGTYGYDEQDIPTFRSFATAGQTLSLLRSDSHLPATRAELVELLGGREIDFLIIDGDHSYEGVKEDFDLYSPLVAKGGLVAFHDVIPHNLMPECEVDRLWEELKPVHRHVEFLEPEHDWGFGQWGGIGVLLW